jgi:hypothetical protein
MGKFIVIALASYCVMLWCLHMVPSLASVLFTIGTINITGTFVAMGLLIFCGYKMVKK